MKVCRMRRPGGRVGPGDRRPGRRRWACRCRCRTWSRWWPSASISATMSPGNLRLAALKWLDIVAPLGSGIRHSTVINSECKIAPDRSREGTVLCLFSHAREEGGAQILAPAQQILAQLAGVPGSESGETFEVQCQVAFLRTSCRVGNGGKRPVRGGEQQLCSLNATLDDRLVRESRWMP